MATCLVCKRGSISTRDVLLRASDEDDTRVSVCNRCPQSQIYDRLKEAATNGGIRLRSPRRNSNIRTHWVSIDTESYTGAPLPTHKVIHNVVIGYTDIAKVMAAAQVCKVRNERSFHELRRWITNGLTSVGLAGFKMNTLVKSATSDYVRQVVKIAKTLRDVTLKIRPLDDRYVLNISYVSKNVLLNLYVDMSDVEISTRRMYDDWIAIANAVLSMSISVPIYATGANGHVIGACDTSTINIREYLCTCCLECVYHMFGSSMDSQAHMHGYFGVDPVIQGYTNCVATPRELAYSPQLFLKDCTALCINPPDTAEESSLITTQLLNYCRASRISVVMVENPHTGRWIRDYFDDYNGGNVSYVLKPVPVLPGGADISDRLVRTMLFHSPICDMRRADF